VDVEVTRKAISTFLQPDPDSRTKEHDGRRIEEIDGGWRLLNYERYREQRDVEIRRETNRNSMRRTRAASRASATDTDGTRAVHSVPVGTKWAQAEAEAEAEADHSLRECSATRARDVTSPRKTRQDYVLPNPLDDPSEDPMVATLIAAIEGEAVLAEAVASPRGLAERIAGKLMARGTPVEWAVAAIGRAADDVAAVRATGVAPSPERVAQTIMRWASNPRRPGVPAAGADAGAGDAGGDGLRRWRSREAGGWCLKSEEDGGEYCPLCRGPFTHTSGGGYICKTCCMPAHICTAPPGEREHWLSRRERNRALPVPVSELLKSVSGGGES